MTDVFLVEKFLWALTRFLKAIPLLQRALSKLCMLLCAHYLIVCLFL